MGSIDMPRDWNVEVRELQGGTSFAAYCMWAVEGRADHIAMTTKEDQEKEFADGSPAYMICWQSAWLIYQHTSLSNLLIDLPTAQPIDQLYGQLICRLTDWPIDRLSNQPIYWSSNCLSNLLTTEKGTEKRSWQIGWSPVWSTDRLPISLSTIHEQTSCLIYWSINCPTD